MLNRQMCALRFLVCVLLVCTLSAGSTSWNWQQRSKECSSSCNLGLVESIPVNLTYPSGSPMHASTYHAWMTLLETASSSLDIASFYWTLNGRGDIKDETDWEGVEIFKKLIAISQRGVKIRIVQSEPSTEFPDFDTQELSMMGAAEVRNINFTAFEGSGILHTKLMIVDQQHFYVGSANMDWRSLTQVKEMGVLGTNCQCLAKDAEQVFAVYWDLSTPGAHVPNPWPASYDAMFNLTHPAQIKINGTSARAFWSSSPPLLNAKYRCNDLDALLHAIDSAQENISVAVMDYSAAFIYRYPNIFWPTVDDALRRAAYDRGVHVRLLGSLWNHTSCDDIKFLQSLTALNGTGSLKGTLEARVFVVPPLSGKDIPYTRVNHNKYMVTDNAAYITTSNWAADYWVDTGGVSLTVNQTGATPPSATLQYQLGQVFVRDWNSKYSLDISSYVESTAYRCEHFS